MLASALFCVSHPVYFSSLRPGHQVSHPCKATDGKVFLLLIQLNEVSCVCNGLCTIETGGIEW